MLKKYKLKKLFTCFAFNLDFEAEKRTAVYGNQPCENVFITYRAA